MQHPAIPHTREIVAHQCFKLHVTLAFVQALAHTLEMQLNRREFGKNVAFRQKTVMHSQISRIFSSLGVLRFIPADIKCPSQLKPRKALVEPPPQWLGYVPSPKNH